MSERTEWRVVCANGAVSVEESDLDAWYYAAEADTENPACGPHRVQSRTVSTSEWADTDVNP